jgi:SAM-dependent methyltransferase
MSYEKLLELYKSTENTELEFRFQVKNRDIFKKLISSVDGEKTMEQTINFISPGLELSRICQLSFVNGVKKTSSYMSKSMVERSPSVDGLLPFKIVLSHEKEIPKFDINLSKFARIKLRLSVRPKEIEGWRIDFTFVKSVTNIKTDLKKDKNNMLYTMNIEDFKTGTAPWDYANSLELEVEHVGENKNVTPSMIDGVTEYLFGIIDPGHKNMFEYQKIVYQIASFVVDGNYLEQFKQKRGIRDLYNRVWELNKQEYFKNVFTCIKDFYLLDKADGTRSLVKIEGNTFSALNGHVNIFTLKTKHNGVTVLDTEYVEHSGVYYVFDVLVYNGENLTKTPTSNRVKYIKKVVEMSEGNAVAKPMVSLTDNYKEEIITMWKNAQESTKYEVDGIIFTPKNESYLKMRSWKWKPLDFMSIDFLVKAAPSNLVGVSPYTPKPGHTMMFLFSGISKQLYDKLRLTPVSGYKKLFPHQSMYKNFPIQFSPSDEPFAYIYYHPDDSKLSKEEVLDNVCEFRRVDLDTEPKWDMMRVRTDRKMELDRGNYFGNGFYIAEYTWQNYQNPLKFEDLVISSTEFMDRGYFKEEKSKIYKPVITFNSFVKGKLLSKFNKSNWLVDLAAGRGQDMFRVSDVGIKNALFIDNDVQALSELVSRKHDFQRGIKRLNTRIYTKLVDLSTDWTQTIKSLKQIGIPVGTVDVVMCNFAIHYLIGTPENTRNLINLINTLLKPGGHFFFTAFNGEKIFELLKEKGAWEIREGEVLKYSIIKKYVGESMEPTGQQIDVLLPFSGGKYYTEYLVNFKYLLNEFSSNGFAVEKKGDFGSFLPLFKTEVARLYKGISKDDVEFLSLYSYGMVRKTTTGGNYNKKNTNTRSSEQNISIISNTYFDKESFSKLFRTPTSSKVVETVDDIEHEMEYSDVGGILRGSTHNGQRKLFLNEIQFLTICKDLGHKYCVYAGSSPGNKTHYLSTLFPDIKFILVDPNRFDIFVNGKSHRDNPHPDIIHIYKHFPTESNVWRVDKKLHDMSEKDKEDTIDMIKNSNHKIFILEDYMDVPTATWLKLLGTSTTFVSDIRSNVRGGKSPEDYDIMWNTAMMYNWIKELQPIKSMLKIRMPYGYDKKKTILHPNDFKQAKENGIDFAKDYMDMTFHMCKSTLYIQPWQRISSGELRMHIDRENIDNIVKYDILQLERKAFYYNCINRSWVWHENPNSSKKLGFCHCNDCALENKIFSDAGLGVHNAVEHIGEVTRRPLYSTHPLQLWEKNIVSNPHEFTRMVDIAKKKYDSEINKWLKNKQKSQRGNTGKSGGTSNTPEVSELVEDRHV